MGMPKVHTVCKETVHVSGRRAGTWCTVKGPAPRAPRGGSRPRDAPSREHQLLSGANGVSQSGPPRNPASRRPPGSPWGPLGASSRSTPDVDWGPCQAEVVSPWALGAWGRCPVPFARGSLWLVARGWPGGLFSRGDHPAAPTPHAVPAVSL